MIQQIQPPDFHRTTAGGATSTNQTSSGRDSWGKWVGRRSVYLRRLGSETLRVLSRAPDITPSKLSSIQFGRACVDSETR